MLGRSGLIVIFAATLGMYFSGMGAKTMDNLNALPPACTSQLVSISPVLGMRVCGILGGAIGGLDRVTSSIGGAIGGASISMAKAYHHLTGLGPADELSQSTSMWDGESSSGNTQSWTSSASILQAKIRQGVELANQGNDWSQRLRNALDDYTIGQQYASTGNANALPWLQKGASVDGYGLMSQLSLGNMYAQGTGGVAANPNAANGYYTQALQSVNTLEGSNAPGANAIFNQMHATPAELRQQILVAITQLRGKH